LSSPWAIPEDSSPLAPPPRAARGKPGGSVVVYPCYSPACRPGHFVLPFRMGPCAGSSGRANRSGCAGGTMNADPILDLTYENRPLKQWLELLQHGQPAERLQGAALWDHLSRVLQEAVPVLIAALRDEDAGVRRQ